MNQGPRRLSQLVQTAGVAAFTREDFFQISGHVSQDPRRLVLVGGQALETWGVLLNVPAPTGDQHPLTADTDWLGSADDAEWLAQLLGGSPCVELTRATLGDSTPNTAVMLLQRPDGRILLMDFLQSVTGLSETDIKALAVTVEIPHVDGSRISLQVLHPLHCLASRMANLKTHTAKRHGNGPLQAIWAVHIVQAYLHHVAASGQAPQVRRACHKVAEMAEYDPAEFCYTQFQIDPLAAVTPAVVAAGGAEFAALDWPHTLQRIQTKQARWLTKLARKRV